MLVNFEKGVLYLSSAELDTLSDELDVVECVYPSADGKHTPLLKIPSSLKKTGTSLLNLPTIQGFLVKGKKTTRPKRNESSEARQNRLKRDRERGAKRRAEETLEARQIRLKKKIDD